GCAVGGLRSSGVAVCAAIAGGLLIACRRRRRRRRRGGVVVLLLVAAAGARPASAATDATLPAAFATAPSSPSGWDFELRFGPYRPTVDGESAGRGQSARPYDQVFGSSQHLMTQIELDRHLSHRAGTWAAGFAIGYYNVTAAALSADLQSRSGDQTSLRL